MDLEQLRELCLSFPGATEGIKWEDHICFMVAEKIFCMTGEQGGVSIKVPPEQAEELTERDGIVATPYMARNHWVTIQQFSRLKPKEWPQYVRQSYDLVRSKLPKKVQQGLG
jgi:predicted DNA-binding protein (MmcQ/YjbR family)